MRLHENRPFHGFFFFEFLKGPVTENLSVEPFSTLVDTARKRAL